MASAGVIDPTKAGRYPVVLSDALLGREPDKVYTGVRYNHKPPAASPSQARLKPTTSSSSKDRSYDLSFRDDDGQYAYEGTRSVGDNRYVLIFDPEREVFVLHKVDSTFNMNVTRTPSNTNPDSLRRKYPPLEGTTTVPKAKAKPAAKNVDKPPLSQKKSSETTSLPFPEKSKPAPPAPKRRQKSPDPEDSSDDDFGLTVENPGGGPSGGRDFSPAFGHYNRDFKNFVQSRNDEDEEEEEADEMVQDAGHDDEENGDDADGEDDDDDGSVELFRLPSPMRDIAGQNGSGNSHSQNSNTQPAPHPQSMDVDESEEDEDGFEEVQASSAAAAKVADASEDDDDGGDDDDGLEAEMMAALEADPGDEQESDVSEEE